MASKPNCKTTDQRVGGSNPSGRATVFSLQIQVDRARVPGGFGLLSGIWGNRSCLNPAWVFLKILPDGQLLAV